MARIIDNENGRRMIKLSTNDIFMIVSMYQQKCSDCKDFTYDEVRKILNLERFYLPEDI
ncbi:MAG: hypothetical protein V2B14_00650 [bacterium]